jgi:hypothetical protein
MKKTILLVLLVCITINYASSQQKYLPKQYINNALAYAQNHFDASATMYAIASALPVDTTGKSASWVYWFYKPNLNDSGYAVTVIVIAGFPILAGLLTPNLPGSFLRPLGTAFCESNLAITAAENAGGRQFRQLHPATTIRGTIYKIPGSADTSKPYWTYIYNDSVNSQNQVFVIDGITCTIIPLGIGQISNEAPQSFSLLQNFPNPFNPSTVISFEVAIKSKVTLKIFDLAGKEVEILVNAELFPGIYHFEFDGSKYTSGLYLYTLEANGFMQTKKMVLIK